MQFLKAKAVAVPIHLVPSRATRTGSALCLIPIARYTAAFCQQQYLFPRRHNEWTMFRRISRMITPSTHVEQQYVGCLRHAIYDNALLQPRSRYSRSFSLSSSKSFKFSTLNFPDNFELSSKDTKIVSQTEDCQHSEIASVSSRSAVGEGHSDEDISRNGIISQSHTLSDTERMDTQLSMSESEFQEMSQTKADLEYTPPDMTVYHYKSTEETFFQWDYRNHPKIEGKNMNNLLNKIEATLNNAHLEPYGRQRGVATVLQNVMDMEVGEKFRLGRNKSFKKLKPINPWNEKEPRPNPKKKKRRINNMLRPTQLCRSLFKLLNDRHAIYASGCTAEISALDEYCLGESFFGPTTHVRVSPRTAKLMLKELWLHGHSSTFNMFQKNHNNYQEILKRKLWKPSLTDD
jgi:hypothetical protein